MAKRQFSSGMMDLVRSTEDENRLSVSRAIENEKKVEPLLIQTPGSSSSPIPTVIPVTQQPEEKQVNMVSVQENGHDKEPMDEVAEALPQQETHFSPSPSKENAVTAVDPVGNENMSMPSDVPHISTPIAQEAHTDASMIQEKSFEENRRPFYVRRRMVTDGMKNEELTRQAYYFSYEIIEAIDEISRRNKIQKSALVRDLLREAINKSYPGIFEETKRYAQMNRERMSNIDRVEAV